jgi:hypothetical protein
MTLSPKDIKVLQDAIYEAVKLGQDQIARDLTDLLRMVAPHRARREGKEWLAVALDGARAEIEAKRNDDTGSTTP